MTSANIITPVAATARAAGLTIRAARPDDAPALAALIAIAGEGIPMHLWSGMARPGQTPLEVGEERARRESGGFSYRNADVVERDGAVVAMLLAYPLTPVAGGEDGPDSADAGLDSLPALLRPLVALERVAAGSYYINALAVFREHRDAGIGGHLLALAREKASAAGCPRLSVQVFNQNRGADRLYRRHGYRPVAERPVVAHPCYPYDDRVLLLMRDA